MVHEPGAAGLGQELGAEADQSTGGHLVLHPDPAGAVVDHLFEASLADRQQLGERPEVLLGSVDGEPLDRFVPLAVDLPGDDLRLADGQLEALPAHQLHQDRQRQLPAALDLPGVRPLGRQHPDGDVADQLGVQPVAQQPCGQLRPRLAGERGGVDTDRHADRRFVHGDDG